MSILIKSTSFIVVHSLSHVQLFATSWTAACLASLSLIISQNFPQVHVHRVSDAIQPSHPLSSPSPPAFIRSIRVFSNELALHIRWPRYWGFSFSISPSSEYSGLISFRMKWFDLLLSKGLSKVFSNTSVQKHQFFGAQPFLLSSSHIHT